MSADHSNIRSLDRRPFGRFERSGLGRVFAQDGIACTGAADRIPKRIRHIVYLDSLILQPGQSAFDAIPADVAEARRKAAQEFSGGVSMPVPDPRAFGITNPADTAWLNAKSTPHPLQTYEMRSP
jgi:hypothetical protein